MQKIKVLNGLVCLFDMFEEEFVLPRFECGHFRGIYWLVSPMHYSRSVRSKADTSPNPPASSPVLAVSIVSWLGGLKIRFIR
jgi:hypothetical protein